MMIPVDSWTTAKRWPVEVFIEDGMLKAHVTSNRFAKDSIDDWVEAKTMKDLKKKIKELVVKPPVVTYDFDLVVAFNTANGVRVYTKKASDRKNKSQGNVWRLYQVYGWQHGLQHQALTVAIESMLTSNWGYGHAIANTDEKLLETRISSREDLEAVTKWVVVLSRLLAKRTNEHNEWYNERRNAIQMQLTKESTSKLAQMIKEIKAFDEGKPVTQTPSQQD